MITPSGMNNPDGIQDSPSRLAMTKRGISPGFWKTAHAHSEITPNAGSFKAPVSAVAAVNSGVTERPAPTVLDPIRASFAPTL